MNPNDARFLVRTLPDMLVGWRGLVYIQGTRAVVPEPIPAPIPEGHHCALAVLTLERHRRSHGPWDRVEVALHPGASWLEMDLRDPAAFDHLLRWVIRELFGGQFRHQGQADSVELLLDEQGLTITGLSTRHLYGTTTDADRCALRGICDLYRREADRRRHLRDLRSMMGPSTDVR
jgi:hypothetical protein